MKEHEALGESMCVGKASRGYLLPAIWVILLIWGLWGAAST